MDSRDLTDALQQQIKQTIDISTSLSIVGGNSKAFYGGNCLAEAKLEMTGHCGVVAYEPSEQVITVRSGSRLRDISNILEEQRQMLGFEPPDFDGQATVGGTVACGFSGPRRPFAGSARDFMLGCKIINGQGEVLDFGGRVMKNVAGFDVSRLMVGALGSLGAILEVSLRVLPMPEAELTFSFQLSERQALIKMNRLSGQPWPLSALAYDGEKLWLRLSGAEAAVNSGFKQLGGDVEANGDVFWRDLREQRLPFFKKNGDLWRIGMAPGELPLALSGDWLVDWGGALRWLKADQPADVVHQTVGSVGGYALLFKGNDKNDWFRMDDELLALQKSIRYSFDPVSIFNPGRLF